MTGAFNNMNKGNIVIYFLFIHIIFYENYMIESLEHVESRLLFRQLQKLSARNIAALKCENGNTKCWVPWHPPPYAVKC